MLLNEAQMAFALQSGRNQSPQQSDKVSNLRAKSRRKPAAAPTTHRTRLARLLPSQFLVSQANISFAMKQSPVAV
ncbi:MAG: hypothetical protein IAG10_12635 [Planctomycetaceae bacterium]|nr:hypothetical protein [Planctomycetaceae bacterium]